MKRSQPDSGYGEFGQPHPKRHNTGQFQYGASVTTEQAQTVTANHYSNRQDGTIQQRELSAIAQARKLNNWIKSVLLSMFTHKDSIALDLCGGKGGDLRKWHFQNISELVLCDSAIGSVKDAMNRYNGFLNEKRISYPITLICCDAFKTKIDTLIDESVYFDIVSSQFAIHYAFGSEETVRGMLHNVTSRLREDGHFVGTIPDTNVLVKSWRAQPTGVHKFGNKHHSVTFQCTTPAMDKDKKLCEDKWITPSISPSPSNDYRHTHTSSPSSSSASSASSSSHSSKRRHSKHGRYSKPGDSDHNDSDIGSDGDGDADANENDDDESSSAEVGSPFAIRYSFTLDDAVDCPEYLLHFPTLVRIASEPPFNLELVLEMNFHEFFVRYHNHPKYSQIFRRSFNPGPDNTRIHNDQWRILYLYKVFAFRKKKSVPSVVVPNRDIPAPQLVQPSDLKVVA